MRNVFANTAANLPAIAAIAAPAVTLPAAVTATLVAATGATKRNAANPNKYGVAARLNPAANATFTLTALGASVAAMGGAGKGGKPTVMGCVAVAAATLLAKGKPLTGANIAAAMQALPAMRTALANTKASNMYAAGGNYCNAWLGGYINGAARNPACLLARVTA